MESILSIVVDETVTCSLSKYNFGNLLYCKGSVDKKDDKILAGCLPQPAAVLFFSI